MEGVITTLQSENLHSKFKVQGLSHYTGFFGNVAIDYCEDKQCLCVTSICIPES